MTTPNSLEIGADDFVRRFSQRSGGLMWLLGAGSSVTAGIPTAAQMIWEFKQQLFVTQRRVSPASVSDFGSPHVRANLQAYIDSSGRLPGFGMPDEYAALFEAAYPSEADRRVYIESKMEGASPSYGHLALATLMRSGHVRIVWTTNFDPLVESASAIVFGSTGPLTTVDLDAPRRARDCIIEERWPLEVKLHGDFRSRRLKNTSDELRHQDGQLRQMLIECCQRFGLIVAGYSGRDDSIMTALEEAVKQENSFPSGLFWLQREADQMLPRVEELLRSANSAGVETAVVMIPNFDEIMRDLIRILDGIDTSVLDDFALDRQRRTGAPIPTGRLTWPVVRLNAIPILEIPSVCRRVVCQIGGAREVREAVTDANVDLIVARRKVGVLAFGSDAAVRQAFSPNKISEFDL